MSDIVNRLRGIFTVHVDPRIGPLDGKMEVTRTFDNLPPIMGEAADAIERLEAERDALRADAARWRWWRAQWCDPDSEAIGEHDIGDCADAESLDAAIDVQIAKSHPNKSHSEAP